VLVVEVPVPTVKPIGPYSMSNNVPVEIQFMVADVAAGVDVIEPGMGHGGGVLVTTTL
jgi:hypothetical protein